MNDVAIEWGFSGFCIAVSLVAIRFVAWRTGRNWLPLLLAIGPAYIAFSIAAYLWGNTVSDLYMGWICTALVLLIGIVMVRRYNSLKVQSLQEVTRRPPRDP